MFDINNSYVIVTGVLILLVAWSLRRSFREQARISKRNPLEEAQKEIATREQSQLNRLDQLEVKLYEYGREVDARSDDRLQVLDELLRDADREINRLRQQLALAQQNAGEVASSTEEPGPDIFVYENPRKFTKAAERRFMIVYLSQAGFSSQEISNCFQCDQSEIETIIAEENEPPSAETA
ncbi:hypothetical protein [uncultured Gimesia sp.]|uniref:hypothetical protein n=1 Tax=uncultured Gimesia sp. TaxID=1678688 RepID=UPI0030D7DC64|tara:strand:+ start:115697 stop:116239 length:543 start_codon:yes stop_codon:yes gene_type:complete